MTEPARTCANPRCKKPLVRKAKDTEFEWRTRRYCGGPCARAMWGRFTIREKA